MITLPTGNDAPRTGKKSADIPSLFESKARQDWDSHLNPKYNFDNYFEGTKQSSGPFFERGYRTGTGKDL